VVTGLLLPTDDVVLYPPGQLDGHGWRQPGTRPSWAGRGALQLLPGVSDARAATGGGHGPHGPARDLTGNLFLPPDAAPVEGMSALIRGRVFVLSQVRQVLDPTGPGIGCWTATVQSTDTWPEGGEPRG